MHPFSVYLRLTTPGFAATPRISDVFEKHLRRNRGSIDVHPEIAERIVDRRHYCPSDRNNTQLAHALYTKSIRRAGQFQVLLSTGGISAVEISK